MQEVNQSSEYDLAVTDAYNQAAQTGEAGDPNSLYADYMREEKVRNIIEQINPDKLVIDIEHRIRGYRKDPFTKKWQPISQKKKVSEEMVSDLISYLGAMLNDNTTMSNFSPNEINNIMFKIIGYVKNNLKDNAEKYGIKGDYDEMTRIGDIVCFEIFAALKRAQNGMEARRIFGALRVQESLNPGQGERKGFIDSLKFW